MLYTMGFLLTHRMRHLQWEQKPARYAMLLSTSQGHVMVQGVMVQVAYACDATGESHGLLRSIIKRSSLLSSGIHNHSDHMPDCSQ